MAPEPATTPRAAQALAAEAAKALPDPRAAALGLFRFVDGLERLLSRRSDATQNGSSVDELPAPGSAAAICRHLERGGELRSPALLQILGQAEPTAPERGPEGEEILPTTRLELTKPTNEEQLEVLRRMEREAAVLVQGPPGTGKTHTLANAIGHALAHGRRVLVTSQRPQALEVLTRHLLPALRPLFVGSEANPEEPSTETLTSVRALMNRLGDTELGEERTALASLRAERDELEAALDTLRSELLRAELTDREDINLGGQPHRPSSAAREVLEAGALHGWIPDEPATDEALPLDSATLARIYADQAAYSDAERARLRAELPPARRVPRPDDFRKRFEALAAKPLGATPARSSTGPLAEADDEALKGLLSRTEKWLQAVQPLRPWARSLVADAIDHRSPRTPWHDLAQKTRNARNLASEARRIGVLVDPILPRDLDVAEAGPALRALRQELGQDGKLGAWKTLKNPLWRRLARDSRVRGARPKTADDWKALSVVAYASLRVRELGLLWTRLVAPIGGPEFESFGRDPTPRAMQYAERIEDWLDGPVKEWHALRDASATIGLRLNAVGARTGDDALASREARLADHLVTPLRTELQLREVEVLVADRDLLARSLEPFARAPGCECVRELLHAIQALDLERYERAHAALERQRDAHREWQERDEALDRIAQVAPLWAAAIRSRSEGHEGPGLPGGADLERAWDLARLRGALRQRARLRIETLEQDVEVTSDRVDELTQRIVEIEAWSHVVDRIGRDDQAALGSWLEAATRGDGAYARFSRAERERVLTLFPVRVMPLAEVKDSLDILNSPFDIVAIDEASQCDVRALPALCAAPQALIVGDEEQVTPTPVGVNQSDIGVLREAHLSEVPHSEHYDDRLSVWSLARLAFHGGQVRLREHFRCLPEIIAFSDRLCYGDLLPLRDGSHLPFSPPVLAQAVDGRRDGRSKRNQGEGDHIVARIEALSQDERYAGQSFGVLSLLGPDQAHAIHKELEQRLGRRECARRELVCGDAASLQGDERDVVFLSMVESPRLDEAGNPSGEPLRLEQRGDYRQRLNVAASRARNQLVVVHSLNPERDLKPGDLRRELILHAEDPKSVALEGRSTRLSWLVEDVRAALEEQGLKVVPGPLIANVVVDLVAEDRSGRRVAVLVAGAEAANTATLTRRAAGVSLLERVGWRVHTIRATRWSADPATEFHCLLEALKARPRAIPAWRRPQT